MRLKDCSGNGFSDDSELYQEFRRFIQILVPWKDSGAFIDNVSKDKEVVLGKNDVRIFFPGL